MFFQNERLYLPGNCLTGALGAKIHKTRVSDPLGRTIDARFATLGDTVASL